MARFFVILTFFLFLLGHEISAEDLSEKGRADAERDFKESGMKLGSWGTEACFRGYGLDSKDLDQYKNVPSGPSFCGCTNPEVRGKNIYIKEYNKKMLELVQLESK